MMCIFQFVPLLSPFMYYIKTGNQIICLFRLFLLQWINTTLLEKYPTLLFFLRNPVGFQWSVLAWGNLEPSYTCVNFLPFLSIASVDGKQHLSEVVFSALVAFSLLGKYPTFRQGKIQTYLECWKSTSPKVWFFVKKFWIKCEEL